MRIVPGLFAVASSLFDQDRHPPAFTGTTRITQMPLRSLRPTIELFCRDERLVRSTYDPVTNRAIYLWGRAAHATLSATASLLRWCAESAEATPSAFRQLYGNFVVVIDDRQRREVTFVSDVLGVRPWFVRHSQSGLVAGSDVLSMHDAGYSDGVLNHDAISSWIRFNYDMTGGSILRQFDRLTGGAVVTYDEHGKVLRQHDYAAFASDNEHLSQQDTLAGIHDRVRHVFNVMTRDLRAVTLPLSGGYDSRYLFAISHERDNLWTTAVNVQSSMAESSIAQQVGDVLGQPVTVLPSGGHTLDLFEDPFAISPSGFPAGRNLASAVARRHPGTPVLSGFLGDLLVRGNGDRCLGQLPSAYSTHELADVAARHHTLKLNRLDLLRPGLTTDIRERSLQAMRRLTQSAPASDKAFVFSNLLGRQRYYIANIFLQHLDSAEAIVPFYSWDLIDFKMRLASDCFSFENYPHLFRAYFGKLSAIPHNSTLQKLSTPAAPRKTRHQRGWAMALLKDSISRSREPSLIDRRKLLRRLPTSFGRSTARHDEILFLYKIRLFEQMLARHRLTMEWNGD